MNLIENILSNSIPETELTTAYGINMAQLSNINETHDMHHIIYKIINVKNGKYYIGQHKTRNPYDYYMGSGHIITNAVRKYGLSSFVKMILFDFDNFEDMNNKEIELVQLSNCWPNDEMSYNMREGGNGDITAETIDRILSTRAAHGVSFKGENNPMYGISPRERMSDEMYDAWLTNLKNYSPTEECKRKISESLSGIEFTEEHKKKIGDGNRGKKKNLTPEQRQELSANAVKRFKGKAKTEEHKKKIGDGNRGKKRTNEMKQHLRELQLGRKHSDDAKAKIGAANRGKTVSAKTRRLISEHNVMKSHKATDFMTEDEIKAWHRKLSENSAGRRKIIHPVTGVRKFVKAEELDTYLGQGYILGSKLP